MHTTNISWPERYDACVPASSNLSWYALRTRSNYEKIAATILEAKGFEQFLPLYQAPKRRTDRLIEGGIPLFPGYLFCRFDRRYRTPVLCALGIVSIVAFGGKPAQISDVEIEAIRRALGSGQNAEPHPYFHEGQRIRIEKGPLRSLEGILVKKNGWRIVISVELLRRSVAVEIDPDSIAPIGPYDVGSPTDVSSSGLRQDRRSCAFPGTLR